MRYWRVLVLSVVLQIPAVMAVAQSILAVAGGGTDDGRPAVVADLNEPVGVALDSAGDLYIADWKNHRIRKVSAATGIITTVAGNGSAGFTGDGGPATEASLNDPMGVAIDGAGNILIADMSNQRVRKVDAKTKIITTVVGNGNYGFGGDGGPAVAASLTYVTGVTVAPSGDLYLVDVGPNRIRRVSASTGIITTFAGSGTHGFSGDGGPATSASMKLSGPDSGSIGIGVPPGVVIDSSGNVYVGDTYNHRIRKVDSAGIITTIAGNGTGGFSGDGGPATSAALNEPSGLTLDSSGNLIIADARNNRIRRLALGTGVITTIAGTGAGPGFAGDGGPAIAAQFLDPVGVAFNAAGDLFIADKFNDRVRRIAAVTSIITTYAGSGVRFAGDGGAATSALILGPAAMAIDPAGPITIAEYDGDRVRRLGTDGKMSTVAGIGQAGSGGDGGPATQARLNNPGGVALDSAGSVYVADVSNNRIRRIAAASGVITTVAGTPTRGFSGDGGPATAANLNLSSPDPKYSLFVGFPSGVAVDSNGDLYFADTYNYRIRKIAAATQVITTIAGTGTAGLSGDGGPALSAQFDSPTGLVIDRNFLYVADTYNHRIRRIDLLVGTITTVAGSGSTGNSGGSFSGDGGPATSARLYNPTGVAVDPAGNLYIADKTNNRIRKVSSGTISTVAGNGRSGLTGDGGPAILATLSNPYGVGVDRKNNIYIADTDANRVRAVFACVTVGPPSLSSPASGASGVSTAPTLSWNKVDGAFRYDLYLSTANPPALMAADLTATAFAPSNLAAGATYFWKIVAKGDPFCTPASTAASETRSFTTTAGCVAPPGFDVAQPADGAAGVSQTVQLSWQSAPGAGTYDLYFGPANPPVLFAGGLSTTTYGVTSLSSNTTYYWYLVAHASCDGSKVRATSVRSFRTGGSCAAAGSFSLSSPAGGASNVPLTSTLAWTASSNAASYDVYLGTSTPPPLYLIDVTRTQVGVSGLVPSRTYYWRIVAKVACDASKNVGSSISSFSTAGGCPAPGATSITFVPPGNVGVGQTYTIAWQEVPDLDEEGTYVIERSLGQGFSPILDSQQTFSTSASFVANSAGTYYHRVHAVRGCDPSHPGPNSEVKSLNVVTGTANVVFTVQPQAVVTSLGDKLEEKKASLTVENLGTSSLQVILGKGEIASVPFFTISDPLGGDSVFVTLEPKKPKSFDVHFSGPANDQTGAYQGLVFVAATGQGLAITPYAFVNLKVGGGATSRPVFVSGGRPTEYAFFPGYAGDDASRPAISIDIRNDGSSPMELGAEIGPEVWLVPQSGWNASPIPAGATRTVQLRSQRNRAPNGSALPRYTYFNVRSKNGETARLLVQDNDAVRTGVGRSSLLDPGSRSYIVPGVTSRAAGGNAVMSRVRLTNLGSEPLQAELFFTPAGADGFDAASVNRATVVVPPNDVVTLTDPLVQVFGLTPPADGQIEVRAAPERIGFLIVSATVITPVATGGAQTYQLAMLRLGEGARIGNGHTIVGLSTSSSFRASLTLAETSGTEATRVHVTIYDDQGNKRGETSETVARYGQKSIDVGAMVGGATLEGGRVDLTVESGGGSVAGVLTVLDGSKNSGLTIVSQPAAGTSAATALVRMLSRRVGQSRVGQASEKATAIVPVVVNGVLPGGGSTAYRTSMGFTVSGAKATAVVTYRPSDPTALAVEKTVPLTPGVTVHFDNVLEQVFGVGSGSSAQGSVFIGGAAGAQIYAQLLSTSGVGGSLGTTGALPIYATVSEVMTSIASRRPLYLDGLEQSIEATRGSRWSVLVNETAGSNGTVTVRLYEAGNRSLPIAEKALSIRGYEQIRLDTVFAALGLDSADRRKDRTNVLCMVTADGGGAIISAVGVATDNATGDTKHYLFSPNGGVPATGVVRVSAVTPVTPGALPPQSAKRRAVRHP